MGRAPEVPRGENSRPAWAEAAGEDGGKMIKVTFRTQEGLYWAVCEALNYVRGSGYFIEGIARDSDSCMPSQWTKTPEDWKIVCVKTV